MSTRRGFFGLLAGAFAAPTVAKLAPIDALLAPPEVLPLAAITMAEFNAITRKAFVPKVSVQLYTQSPMLSLMMKDRAHDGL